MNRKGFTLIEVLAVIVILGTIFVFVAPNIITIYENSKLKSEQIFLDRLSQTIDSYIKLNVGEITFNEEITGTKCTEYQKIDDEEICKSDSTYSVTISKKTIPMQDIIDEKIITNDDYVNAGNKDAKCNTNAKIEIYKDSDYVYCHKVEKETLECLSEEYKETITDTYAINTCIWE